MTRWYRAYEGTVTDAKLGEVALVAETSRSVAIAAWHCILESCASAQAGGAYETSARRVAVILGESVETVSAVFAALTKLGMICDGAVTAWKEDQQRGRLPAHEWRELIRQVFERDDFTCRYCGSRGVELECDHVHPLARGGSNDLANLATACKTCNRSKGAKMLEDWVQ